MRGGARSPRCLAALVLCTVLGGSAPVAAAEAPKAPEAKLPEMKAPKAPEAKAPEVKLPVEEVPELAPPEAPAVELPAMKLPAQLAGGEGGEGGGEAGVQVQELKDGQALTIKDIVESLVTTASNRPESTSEAPASIITITGEELRARGYHELTDLLDDLPSMDVVRGWGDTYFKNYWRGYRNNIGDPFLLMVDGVTLNHLFLGEVQIMAAIPLSNVERVEVVYGPASALYGPNASMGVINVITRRDLPDKQSTGVWAQIGMRSPQGSLGQLDEMTKVADVSALYKGQGFRVSVAGRFDFGVLDPAVSERFEWLKDTYSTDASLWGDFLNYPSIAGTFRSPSEKQSLDARLIVEKRNDERRVVGETEVAAQMYRMVNGSGLIYPADKYHVRSLYTVLEQSLSLRHRQELSGSLNSNTLLRYRRSNVDNPTSVLMRDSDTNAVTFKYLEHKNSSLSVSQGFGLFAGGDLMSRGDKLFFDFGFQFERRDLDAGTVVAADPWDPSVSFEDEDGGLLYDFPSPGESQNNLQNLNHFDSWGSYLLSKYKFWERHSVLLGLRVDYNTFFNEVTPTFRGGYVGRFLKDDLTVKLLYGQAVEEPGFNNLVHIDAEDKGSPEHSQTVELGLGYKLDWLMLHGTVYYVHFDGTIDTDTYVVVNEDGSTTETSLEGIRRMAGADLGATALIRLEGIRQLRVWGYYSPYLLAQQTALVDSVPTLVETGDLARHKLLLGATLEVNRYFSATALGRCMSERNPVSTNSLGTVPAYCVVDANVRLQDVFTEGLSLSLRVSNLLDTQFVHPGLYTADSGNDPGRWEGSQWIGSSGSTNSQMPQPGRAFALQLGLNL